eukprot:47511-Prorocentrum_minimum.AAC.7
MARHPVGIAVSSGVAHVAGARRAPSEGRAHIPLQAAAGGPVQCHRRAVSGGARKQRAALLPGAARARGGVP